MVKIFALCILLAPSVLSAQKTTTTTTLPRDANLSLKPLQGDMGITVGFDGLSTINFNTTFGNGSTILFRYYLRDDIALRTRINMTLNSSTSNGTDTSGKSTLKNSAVNINLGLQKDFALNSKRIEPYITGEILIGGARIGVTKTTTTFGTTTTETTVKPGSSFNFGVLSNVGFNYFFSDHVAFGAEFGYGFSATFTGKTKTTIEVTENGNTNTTTSETGTSNFVGIGGTGGIGSIMFSVFFGMPKMQKQTKPAK